MIIPYQELSPEILNALAEEFVSREGTDYGVVESSFQNKIERVIRQIKSGDAVILYSELHESCTIISKQQWAERQHEQEGSREDEF